MRHRGFEACATAEAEPGERGDVEAAAPDAVELLGEGPADFVAAGADEVDARVRIEAVHGEHARGMIDERILGDGAREEFFQDG